MLYIRAYIILCAAAIGHHLIANRFWRSAMTSLPLAEIVAYIRARLPEAPAPGEVAAHFGINRFMLSRRFRTETGLSLRE